MPYKLQPCDVLLFYNEYTDVWNKIYRWGLESPYTHVLMYLGQWAISRPSTGSEVTIPMIYESVGRGVITRPPFSYVGDKMMILRPYINDTQREQIVNNALDIAFALNSYYDYLTFGNLAVILALQKLHLHIPLAYQRNSSMICTECVAEPFWRAGLYPVSPNRAPIPSDFLNWPDCEKVGLLTVSPEMWE